MDMPPPPQDVPPSMPAGTAISQTDRQWAIGIHLSGLLGCFVPHLLNVLAPLVIWLIKKQESAYLDSVGKRVLNFQLSYSLYGFVAASLAALLMWVIVGLLILPVYAIIAVAWLVLTIIGAVKESNGETYEFPLTIKFFS